MTEATLDAGELSFYLDTVPGELADLEVAAAAAIKWAQAIKAAATALNPDCDYRVSLVAAKPGSSNWIAKIEQSAPNRALKRVERGWKKMPLIARVGIGLAVVIPTTAVPTIDYWLGNDGFSDTQKAELVEIYNQVVDAPAVKSGRQSVYKEAQRDPKITGIGTGVPTGEHWKPANTIPSNQFAEAEGLFDAQVDNSPDERSISQTLDVILVTPRLENARRAWTFRQEGIPGSFNAEMNDANFLAALDRSGIHENLRANIPMTIRMEIKQERVNGEWRVKKRGRQIVEVISPVVE